MGKDGRTDGGPSKMCSKRKREGDKDRHALNAFRSQQLVFYTIRRFLLQSIHESTEKCTARCPLVVLMIIAK